MQGNCVPRKENEIYFAKVSSSLSRQILGKSWRQFTKHQPCSSTQEHKTQKFPDTRKWDTGSVPLEQQQKQRQVACVSTLLTAAPTCWNKESSFGLGVKTIASSCTLQSPIDVYCQILPPVQNYRDYVLSKLKTNVGLSEGLKKGFDKSREEQRPQRLCIWQSYQEKTCLVSEQMVTTITRLTAENQTVIKAQSGQDSVFPITSRWRSR